MKNEVKKLIMGVALVELMLVTALTITSCTDSNASIEAVEAMGMTDVQIIGYSPFSCSNDDFSSTEFSAVNSQGQHVNGVVCCGLLFKNCTVRW